MRHLAIVISAHNEEKVLGRTLGCLNPVVSPKDVYVISDCSTDKTEEIARSFGATCLLNKFRLGKTKSIKLVLKECAILSRYQFVFFLDADTQPAKDFLSYALARISDPNVACVCGQVITEEKNNLFLVYRAVSLFLWQNLYKRILSAFDAIPIAPGTASIYKSAVLKAMEICEDIIIEDFDMTFQVHRKRLGKIVYEPKAKVTTQDPDNLSDYFRQLVRWDLGLLQTMVKHRVPLGRQAFDFALLYLLIQEVLHSLFLVIVPPLIIWLYFYALYPSLLGVYFERTTVLALLIFDIYLVWGFSLQWVLISKRPLGLIFGPFLWLIQYIHIFAFATAIFRVVFPPTLGGWRSPQRR
jgi:cellulose synthase/poly-beta-1,6-N-acetylglucosamine synthase-like glycosyltransferase